MGSNVVIIILSMSVSGILQYSISTLLEAEPSKKKSLDYGSNFASDNEYDHSFYSTSYETKTSKNIVSMTFEYADIDGDYGYNNVKILLITTMNGKKTKIKLWQKPSILSPNINVEVCSKNCTTEELEDAIFSCASKGKMANDPDSIITVVGCPWDDVDVNIVSTKNDFGGTIFRKTKEGKIETIKHKHLKRKRVKSSQLSLPRQRSLFMNGTHLWFTTSNGIPEPIYDHDYEGSYEPSSMEKAMREEGWKKISRDESMAMEGWNRVSRDESMGEEGWNRVSREESMEGNKRNEGNVKNTIDLALRELFELEQETIGNRHRSFRNVFSAQNEKITKMAPILYREKTLEIGVVVSPIYYNIIKDQSQKSEKEVKNIILKHIHFYMIQMEAYLLHKSISETGGFSVILSGLKILKNYEHEDAMPMNGLTDEDSLYKAFREYAKKWNNGWDGSRDHYDLMLLLNGYKQAGSYRSASGFANTNSVCNDDAIGIITVSLENSKPRMDMGKLIAHEVGHILGATHDGSRNHCQDGIYLMSRIVTSMSNGWSECSRRDIDTDLHSSKTCYYT